MICSGYDGESCWVHARAGAIPAEDTVEKLNHPVVVLTTQKLLLTGSDVFYALNGTRTETLRKSWENMVRQRQHIHDHEGGRAANRTGQRPHAVDGRGENAIIVFSANVMVDSGEAAAQQN